MPIAAGILATETAANWLSKAAGMLRFVARLSGQFFTCFYNDFKIFFNEKEPKI